MLTVNISAWFTIKDANSHDPTHLQSFNLPEFQVVTFSSYSSGDKLVRNQQNTQKDTQVNKTTCFQQVFFIVIFHIKQVHYKGKAILQKKRTRSNSTYINIILWSMFKLKIITLKDTIGSCQLVFPLPVTQRLQPADTDVMWGTAQTEVTVGIVSPSCTGYSMNYLCFSMQMNTGAQNWPECENSLHIRATVTVWRPVWTAVTLSGTVVVWFYTCILVISVRWKPWHHPQYKGEANTIYCLSSTLTEAPVWNIFIWLWNLSHEDLLVSLFANSHHPSFFSAFSVLPISATEVRVIQTPIIGAICATVFLV